MAAKVMPKLTPEERERALAAAMEARKLRGAWIRDLKAGKKSLADCLKASETDKVLGKMKTVALIRTQKGYGEKKALALMEELGIAPSRRLNGVGVRQRKALVEHFAAE